MGYWKEKHLEMMEGGYDLVPERFVCTQCLTDDELVTTLYAGDEEAVCTYCDGDGAVPVDDLVSEVSAAICRGFTDPGNELPYESAEGGYQGTVESGDEIVRWHLDPWTDSQGLLDDVASAFAGSFWCRRNYFALDRYEGLQFGWKQFVQQVKHVTRYLFLQELEQDEFADPESIPPGQMLDALAALMRDHLKLLELRPETSIHRVRVHEVGRKYTTVDELGPPLHTVASGSNRMSPAGIPMFYGALDEQTAILETFDPNDGAGKELTLAVFKPARTLRLLDLTDLPVVPSQFDEGEWHLRNPIAFLRGFVADLRKPVSRDGMEHVDYVPTQVVTEYVRHRLRWIDGEPLDGIAFQSSRIGGETSLVLFADRAACGPRPDRQAWELEPIVNLERYRVAKPNEL